MKERPILFSAPMVRALLDGRKTQTRRLVKPQPEWLPEVSSTRCTNGIFWPIGSLGQQCGAPIPSCPYGVPGDRLWVREACWIFGQWHQEGLTAASRPRWRFKPIGREVLYENPGHGRIAHLGRGPGWSHRNSIHMPRWASRLTLDLTDVRIERLTTCSEADALAEGILEYEADQDEDGDPAEYAWDEVRGRGEIFASAREAYADLWRHINGPGSWEANPWVWALTFQIVTP